MTKRAYVQFSKKIVIVVTLCVTLITAAGIVLTYLGSQLSQVTQIIKSYINFATIVFASYSGNSIAEKWINRQENTDKTEAEG